MLLLLRESQLQAFCNLYIFVYFMHYLPSYTSILNFDVSAQSCPDAIEQTGCPNGDAVATSKCDDILADAAFTACHGV